jgi:hypothetical protein
MLMDINLSDGGPELSNHDIMRMYVMVEAVRDTMARVLRAKKMDAAAILDEVRRKESAAATLGYRHEIDDAGNIRVIISSVRKA